ncbi:M1 family metallopeptidase [candidate division KSB1 bacterium]|nr:M1 family metallopeptidase [candidate division KSB1 bacterium]
MFRRTLTAFRRLGLASLLLLSGPAASLADHETPPATPAEFHATEAQRYERVLAEPTLKWDHAPEYDALYYRLTIDVRNYAGRQITAQLELAAACAELQLAELHFDLCDALIVDSIRSAGVAVAFTHLANEITVSLERQYTLGEPLAISVWYHGTPCVTNGQWSFWYYTRQIGPAQIPAIHTISEPLGARDWWPCKDTPEDKADSVTIAVICADTLTATSNGTLDSTIALPAGAKRVVWTERKPIATYLITINVTNYRFYRNWYVALNGDSIPIDHYTYPERYNQSVLSWSPLPSMMGYLAQRFGEYPFASEKYGHSMNNFPGGMEHQCNTSYGRVITTGTRTYDYILVHEVAHQWWGDCVTLLDWPDIWLNEGFASYCEALWMEQAGGFDSLRTWMTTPGFNGVVDPSGPLYNPDPLFSSNTVYNKGSWILHILRGVIRDDSLFWAVLREYRARHAYGSATTADFLAAAADVTGLDVDGYLHAYLYRTNRPLYEVSSGTGTVGGDPLSVIRIQQVQSDPDTTFRTRLDLTWNSGAEQHTVEHAARGERYYFDAAITPGSLAVDPDDWVLKGVSFVPLPLTILNDELPPATAGSLYTEQFVAIGGSGVLLWAQVAGQLPPGIVLLPDGHLTGTTLYGSDFDFLVRADGTGSFDTLWCRLHVNGPPMAPHYLTLYALNGALVQLRWKESQPADSFHVWRATQPDMSDRLLIGTTAQFTWTDSTAAMPQVPDSLRIPIPRFYEVTAVSNE